MKRFLIIAALMFSMACLTSCSSTTAHQAYVKINDEWRSVSVKATCVHDGGVWHLTLQDGTELWIHAENCILYEGTLPIKK